MYLQGMLTSLSYGVVSSSTTVSKKNNALIFTSLLVKLCNSSSVCAGRKTYVNL